MTIFPAGLGEDKGRRHSRLGRRQSRLRHLLQLGPGQRRRAPITRPAILPLPIILDIVGGPPLR